MADAFANFMLWVLAVGIGALMGLFMWGVFSELRYVFRKHRSPRD
jgi:hypothetical protein